MKKVMCYVYSRVVGYYQPIQNWNKGKKEEFKDRVPFSLDKIKSKINKEEKDAITS